MKRNVLLLAIIALLGINACEKQPQNKGHFEKNIPKCLKEQVKQDRSIESVKEYCNENGTERIYYFDYGENPIWQGFENPLWVYDENCSFLAINSEDHTWIPSSSLDDMPIGNFLPNGTIEYKDEIYHFKRIVFTQKNKK